MSERFGIPDHAPPHAPDHVPQNPTPQGSWDTGSDWSSGTTSAPQSYSGGHYGGVAVASGPSRKSVRFAIIVAALFGPLGLFYVSFLNGAAAIIFVWTVVRSLALVVAAASGGRLEPIQVLIPTLWATMIPWAIIGARRRNRKLDQLVT